ncbi:FAD-dependent oxidoreductase [Halalkalibaculum sp. DA3122]|uniref:FAD-dependent oxidoreductase n=1 Tax=Halalkalibaculum sp. DA3122 TaxID=3373607 RepID=UPI003754023A
MDSRKDFFKKLGLFFTGTLFGGSSNSGLESKPEFTMSEEKKEILQKDSINKEYEVVVVGGGLAGITASISAARNGVKVALIHNRSMFGGSSSSEVKLEPEPTDRFNPWIKEGGIFEEIYIEERVRNHNSFGGNKLNAIWDLVLYEWILNEENIDAYLNTHMHNVVMADESTIESIYCIQLGSNKDYFFKAPLFVDTTGDGNLGYFSGAEYKWGRESQDEFEEPLAPSEPDRYHMGNTYYFNARDTGNPVPFKRPDWASEFESEEDLLSRGHHNHPSEDIIGGYWWMEISEPYHWVEDMNEGRHVALKQILGVWDHLKNKGDHGVENYGLEFVGTWPYKRDAYRIQGDYVLTQHNVQNPQKLEDAVAYGAWYIDLHNKGGILNNDKVPAWEYFHTVGSKVYGIPLRSLYSKNINNLMMAGRPISCSYLAFASSRVLPTGAVTGQAVGVAASLAVKNKILPKEVANGYAEECQQILLRQDCHIPGVVNKDPRDLARKANMSASSSSPLLFPDANNSHELNEPCAQLFPFSGDRIESVKLLLHSRSEKAQKIRLGLRRSQSVWDFRSEKDIAVTHSVVPANFNGWIEFKFDTPVKPNQLYYIYTDQHSDIYWKSYHDSHDGATQTPVATTAAVQPSKPPYKEHPESFQEIYPPTDIKDLPGAGRNGFWEPLTRGKCFSIKVTPSSYPYEASNVNRGTNRPDQWSNIWISDPADPLPAWIKLDWESPQRFNTVQITFDTNQNYRVTKSLYRYPESVKKYIIEYQKDGGWQELIREEDNYRRRRVHSFKAIQTTALRLRVLETNGAPEARIYEMRVYND